MEYRLCVFTEWVKWVQDREGVYWVNPTYLDEFLNLFDTLALKK